MNRSSVWKWYLCCLLHLLTCCAHKKPIEAAYNPMSGIWTGIGDQINKLEAEHANMGQWRSASGPEVKAVNSVSDLVTETRYANLASDEQAGLAEAFKQSSSVVHYGFDCNFHALVFFDNNQRNWKVIKW